MSKINTRKNSNYPKNLVPIAATLFIVAGLLLIFPWISRILNNKYHSDVETTYTAAIEDTDDAELTAQRQAAVQYNAMLANATIHEGGASAPPLAYTEQLTVGGVMCYIDIPKINVYLPVQYGTGADTLEKSVGHVVGTSLPVGGSSTHAVLSAHSGMASSSYFRILTNSKRVTSFLSMSWVTHWPTKWTASTQWCLQIRACCKLRKARIWSRL